MDADISAAAREAAGVALKMGSSAAEVVVFIADLGEELPLLSPVLKTLKAIRDKTDTVTENRENLETLQERCAYVTACVIVKCRQRPDSAMDVTPLEDCINKVRVFVDRFCRRRKVWRLLKASSDKEEMARLTASIDKLRDDLGLAGIVTLNEKVTDFKASLEEIIANLPKPPTKLAAIPRGTPTQKSWHVERRQVKTEVVDALTSGKGACLVGLVGASGSGKTTAAAEVVRSPEVRGFFSDGIVWLPVNHVAKERLPSLMLKLACTVYEDVGGSVGRRPEGAGDGAAYVKEYMENGLAGKGLRCLVVADNVWDRETVSKLLETGMSVLLTTRERELVTDVLMTGGVQVAVQIDELSKPDAEAVLKRAAELPLDVRLPDDALDLIELCGRVAMDLAFVGRWSDIRGRDDRAAWSDATEKVRKEMSKLGGAYPGGDSPEDCREKRRKAILSAGFEDLAIGSEDERVQRLYLSLAVLPDGRRFSVKDAAMLLYDRTPRLEDEASVGGVVSVLERWSVISLLEGAYQMHDAHSSFAREGLLDRGNVRRPAVERWVKYISSLEALRDIDRYELKGLWMAVEDVGGDCWMKTRPYLTALGAMDRPNSLVRRQTIEALGHFQEVQGDWEGVSATWRLLLDAEEEDLGLDHPYVLNTYQLLAVCADRLGSAEEAAEWREKERQGLPLALARVSNDGNVDLGEELDVADDLGSLALTMLKLKPDDSDEAERLLGRCLEIQEAKLGPEDVAVAHTLHELSLILRQTGRLEEAEKLLRRCLEIKKAKLDRECVSVARTLHELGICVRLAGRLEEAEKCLRESLAVQEAKLGAEDVAVAYTLHQLGLWVREAGRLQESEDLLRRSLEIKEAKLGSQDVAVAYTLHELGICLLLERRLEESEKLLERCLSIEVAKLGPEDLQVAITLFQLGLVVRELDRPEEAEECLRRSLSITEASRGPGYVAVARIVYQLSVWAGEMGRFEEAERLLKRCLAIEEDNLGLKDAQVGYTLHQLGVFTRMAGKLVEASELLRRSLRIKELRLGPETVEVAYTLLELGVCARLEGEPEKAEELLRRSLAIMESSKSDPTDVAMAMAMALHELSACARLAGRRVEARELFGRALAMKKS